MAVKFKVRREYQTKQAIKEGGHLGTEDLVKEYSRLGRLTNARIDRLKAKYPRAESLREMEKIPDVKNFLDEKGNIADMSGFSSSMASSYKFLRRNYTTIKGFEKQLRNAINSFNILYYGKDEETGRPKGRYFNKNNIFDLFDFLKDYRDKNKNQVQLDSDQLTDTFVGGDMVNMALDSLLENIDYWSEHADDLKLIEPEDEPHDSDYFKQKIALKKLELQNK